MQSGHAKRDVEPAELSNGQENPGWFAANGIKKNYLKR